MQATRTIRVASRLNAEAADVWATLSTIAGVNQELSPWIQMNMPAKLAHFRIEDAPLGKLAYRSRMSLGGILPFDLHGLVLTAVEPGRGFDEDSTSLIQRQWQHRRRVSAHAEGGCVVSDQVRFAPRAALLAGLAEVLVTRVFRHRHERLQRRFGGTFVDAPEIAALSGA